MLKKIACIGMMLVMAFSLGACGEKFALDRVVVIVNTDFRQKFDVHEFVTEDFKWDNVEKLIYNPEWTHTTQDAMIVVILKKHGKKHVLAAVKHFVKLDFVKTAEPSYYGSYHV